MQNRYWESSHCLLMHFFRPLVSFSCGESIFDLFDAYVIFHTSCYLLLIYLLFLLSHYLDFNICFLSVRSRFPAVCMRRKESRDIPIWLAQRNPQDGWPRVGGGIEGEVRSRVVLLLCFMNFFKWNKTSLGKKYCS